MENVIKKIFSKISDENIHSEFIKFSRGVFENKYLLDIKKQKDRWSVKTGPEFANFLVRRCLGEIKGPVEIKGVMVSTMDIRKELPFEVSKVKQFMGIKQVEVNTTISPEKIISLMNKLPKVFYALSFKTEDFELKIKPKAPKSAKPASSGEKEPKAEFCSLKTSDQSLVRDLAFDAPDFKEFSARHTLKIEEIEIPKGEKDPVKMRENAIRKGKIIRKIRIDGKEMFKESPFSA